MGIMIGVLLLRMPFSSFPEEEVVGWGGMGRWRCGCSYSTLSFVCSK